MKSIKKRHAITAFLAIVLISGFLFGYFILQAGLYLSPISLLEINGLPGSYSVISGSMEPSIKTGALAISIPIKNYKTGDVVTFSEDDKNKNLVTHRIAAAFYSEKEKTFVYYTKGDANRVIDTKPVYKSRIIGKSVIAIPYLGIAASSVKDPRMFILFVIVPATIIVYEELKYIKSEFNKKLKKLLKRPHTSNAPFTIVTNGINKSFILIPLIAVAIIVSGISGAYFLDLKTSTNNTLVTGTFTSATPAPTVLPSATPTPTCNIAWADSVVASSQGTRKDGTAILADRTDPSKVLGAAQSNGLTDDTPVISGSFYSLGFKRESQDGGSITVSFANPFNNIDGNDIQIYEVTGGAYPQENAKIEASQDGNGWTVLTNSLTYDGGVDLGSLPWAKFVRITDVSNPALFDNTADAYDLDAVKVLCQT